MKTFALAAAALLAAGAAAAQPAPMTPLPKLMQGYVHHDITPGLCHNLSPQETDCTVPEMTAGQYEIIATGTSTSTAAGAQQKLTVVVGNVMCGTAQTNANPNWAANTPKTLKYACQANLLTDNALTVKVFYADAKANKDPKGPTLSMRRIPWTGVLSLTGAGAAQQ